MIWRQRADRRLLFPEQALGHRIQGPPAASIGAALSSSANGFVYSALNNAGSSIGTSAIMGQDISLTGIAGGMAGNYVANKMVGNLNAVQGGAAKNVFNETMHGAGRGFVSGYVGGMATNALNGDPLNSNLGSYIQNGMIGGAAGGLWKATLFGRTRMGPTDPKTQKRLELGKKAHDVSADPLYRSGGIWGALSYLGLLPDGFAGFGREIIVNEFGTAHENEYNWIHETSHFWSYETVGYAIGVGRLVNEQFTRIVGINPYEKRGWHEWQANQYTRQLQSIY